MLELCSKNGNHFFHKILAQEQFCETFLELLKGVLVQYNALEERKENPDEEDAVEAGAHSVGKVRGLTALPGLALGGHLHDA